MTALKPLPGRVLVELKDKLAHVAVEKEKYEPYTSGICMATSPIDFSSPEVILGKHVFFEEYKAHATIERDGTKYAFVKIEDIDGWEDAPAK